MRKYFSIIDNKKRKYTKECVYDVFDIEDCRDFSKEYPLLEEKNLILTDKISNMFLQQLAEQISRQICITLNRKKPANSYLVLDDRYIVNIDDKMFMCIVLYWDKDVTADLWIKYSNVNGQIDISKDGNFVFQLCSVEEAYRCSIIRFGFPFKYWVDRMNCCFELYSKAQPREEQLFPQSYPDVIINCHFKRKTNGINKKQVYSYLKKYIEDWNSNENNNDKIHFFSLIENGLDNTISVHIDYGNCEPSALVDMVEELMSSDLGINKISFK